MIIFTTENNMDHLLKIHRFSFNHPESMNLDFEEVDWLKEIFNDLDSIREKFPDQEKDMLQVELQLVRKTNSTFNDYFIIRGKINCHYYAPCIRCLAPSKETINVDFAACYLLASLENSEEYKDLSDIYCDGEEMDLYFFDKGKIDLKELVNEHVHLNANPHPVHSENCKGLCSLCGFNLNFGKCIHHRIEKK